MERAKYFIFNKEQDYESGLSAGVTFAGGRLTLAPGDSAGWFVSRILDAGERGNEWHRVLIDGVFGKDSYYNLSFYCFDNIEEGESALEVLRDETPMAEKLARLGKYAVAHQSNANDFLLHEAKGRYLFFKLDFFGSGSDMPYIDCIRVCFPKQSILEYLPEVYRTGGDTFLERYLSLFSSLYLDLEKTIDNIAVYLDYDVVDGDILTWLAEVLNVCEAGLWQEERLRLLVQNAVPLYQKKGTVAGLSKLIEIYTGEKPYIVESFRLRRFEKVRTQKRVLQTLYSNHPYHITIILPHGSVESQKQLAALDRMVCMHKPVTIEHSLVVQKKRILLDRYTYLGMNTVLSDYDELKINEFMEIPFAKVGGMRLAAETKADESMQRGVSL